MSNDKQIPTALEFLHRDESGVFNEVDITQAMIEFAKLHVEAALEEASTKALMDEDWVYDGENENHIYTGINKDSILDAYPLTNII